MNLFLRGAEFPSGKTRTVGEPAAEETRAARGQRWRLGAKGRAWQRDNKTRRNTYHRNWYAANRTARRAYLNAKQNEYRSKARELRA